MLYLISNVRVELDEPESTVSQRLLRQLKLPARALRSCRCARRAIDARKKSSIHFVCNYEVELNQPLSEPLPAHVRYIEHSSLQPQTAALQTDSHRKHEHVVVIGAGPAGLFAALALAEAGIRVTLLERGRPVETRMRDIGRLRSRGELNPESNVCFGEGGAGTYTDGKLYTRIKHPFLRQVLHTFVRFGGSPEILVDAHPHLGTDKLVRIVRNMRHHLIDLGVDYRFETRVDDLLIADGNVTGVRTAHGEEITASHVVLATGHSARDTFERLQQLGIRMEAKSFAVGVRAEHPQALIDSIQFGSGAAHPKLGAAEYSLTYQAEDRHLGQRGIYSFCMCPGGLIVPSPTEEGAMAVNGMSNAKRAGQWANSGIVVQITPEDLERHGIPAHPLMGIAFQRQLEVATFEAAGHRYAAPTMRLTDFVDGKATGTLAATRFKPEAVAADLHTVLPDWVAKPLAEGFRGFDRKMRGYLTDEANLFGSETRTSSPVRIERNEQMQSINTAGLYPVGEGAGYAGGIVSAAVDGMKAAAAIIGLH
ncbi:FAD-dependent oxidoreductase [Mariprofundus erugo]|uniref:FAD-dependent oxidoreductase n=1 Tax=Mariprofundus erugo TaxID=2528639 RepID=A0A5R9GSL6_9PROT|nr:FAD-dependent oxidoreductase [Mariprofundus erugo]TLS66244.1 FAD-dependent oxidoreductase [Mariprofundus erugo]